MSRIIFFVFSLLFLKGVTAQTVSKQAAFETAIKEIVSALKKRDNKIIKKYIDPKTGFYLLYRNGVFDRYLHMPGVNLKNHTNYPQTNVAYSGSLPSKILYTKMPVFDCDTDKWSKTGSFADTSGKATPLSAIAKDLVKYDLQEISKKEMQKLESIEKGSWKVVLASKKDEHCIFYLAWRKGRWVLTVFDSVTTDCSA